VVVFCMLALVVVMAICIMALTEGVGTVWVLEFVVMLVVSSICTFLPSSSPFVFPSS